MTHQPTSQTHTRSTTKAPASIASSKQATLFQSPAFDALPPKAEMPTSTDASYRQASHPSSFSTGLQRLCVSSLPQQKPEFHTGETRDVIIARWLTEWTQAGLASGEFSQQHLLPLKKDIAETLNVSVGTVQNAIRLMEDNGVVESKQRIGTLLRLADESSSARVRKQTSKRDTAVLAIQHYILEQGLTLGDTLPSAKDLGEAIGAKVNTTRLAMEYLTSLGQLENKGKKGKQPNWILTQLPNQTAGNGAGFQGVMSTTLIDQLERDLKQLLASESEVNDRLPSHFELAERFRVSIKTVHDAIQRLVEQGFVHSKRGRYGTFVTRIPTHLINPSLVEQFFVPAEAHNAQESNIAFNVEAAPPYDATAAFYGYEKVIDYVRSLIQSEGLSVGSRLPKQKVLADACQVSLNSVRDGLKRLEEEGLLRIEQGRSGGAVLL